jgi:hypothetical protein
MCGRIISRTLFGSLFTILFIGTLLYIGSKEDRSSGTITGLSFATIVLIIIGLSALSTFKRKRIRG